MEDWRLSSEELIIIGRLIAKSETGWESFGLFFEEFGVTIDDVKIDLPKPHTTNALCQEFLKRLKERRVPINKVIAVLENPLVGLNSVAKLIKDKYNLAEESRSAMSKFLVIQRKTDNALKNQLENFLKSVHFKLEGHFAGVPVYSYHPILSTPITCPCYVLIVSIDDMVSAYEFTDTLYFASSLLMVIEDTERRQYSNNDIIEKLNSLSEPFCDSLGFIWMILQEARHNHIRKQLYGFPMGGSIKRVDLGYWTACEETWKTKDKWYLGVKFQEATMTIEHLSKATATTIAGVTQYQNVEVHGAGHSSINVFISGNCILPTVLLLKKDEIKKAFEKQGLQLISIFELSIEDIVNMQNNPKNQAFVTDLDLLIDKMIEDKVSMTLDNESRWQITSFDVPEAVNLQQNLPEKHSELNDAQVVKSPLEEDIIVAVQTLHIEENKIGTISANDKYQFLSTELAQHMAAEPKPKKTFYEAGDREFIDSNFTLDILGNKVPVIPLLRGRQWKAINTAVAIPLVESNDNKLPVVTFGHVFPPRVSYMQKEGLALIGKSVKELKKAALKNLKDIKYSWRENEFQVNKVKLPTLVCNENFSAEKILDPDFLIEAEALLVKRHSSLFGNGTEDSIAVIIPCVGELVAMKFEMKLLPYLRGLSQALFDQADESHQLTTAVFNVLGGGIIGCVSFKDENLDDLDTKPRNIVRHSTS